MSRPWIFLCPSTRGIGLALGRHLLRTTSAPILATSRSADLSAAKAQLLAGLDSDDAAAQRLTVVRADVTDEAAVQAAAARAAELFPRATHHLRLALALPGILRPEKAARRVGYADALETFKVNALGPLVLMKWFGEFLPRRSTPLDDGEGLPEGHAVWVSMSARVGSVADNRSGGWFSYRSSKAAVNSLTKSFDHELRTRSGEKAMAVAYHPGTVRTDFSKEFWESTDPDVLLEPDVAAAKMAHVVVKQVGLDGRGRCWDHKGQEIPP